MRGRVGWGGPRAGSAALAQELRSPTPVVFCFPPFDHRLPAPPLERASAADGDAAYGCSSAHAPRVCLHAWALALPLHRAGEAGRRGKIVRRLVGRLRHRPASVGGRKSSAASEGDHEGAALAEDGEPAAKRPARDGAGAAGPVVGAAAPAARESAEAAAGCWVGSRSAAETELGAAVVRESRIPCRPMLAFAPADFVALVE